MYDNPPNNKMLLNNSIIQSKLFPNKNVPNDIRSSLGLNGNSISGE